MGKYRELDYAKYKGQSYTASVTELEVGDPCPCCYFNSDGRKLWYSVIKVDYVGLSWECQIRRHGALDMAKFLIKNFDKIRDAKELKPAENEWGPVTP